MNPIPISCEITVNRIGTRSDGSVSIAIQTNREFDEKELLALLTLNRQVCDMTLQPKGSEESPFEIKGGDELKTPSERLRACLYVLWCSLDEKSRGTFPDFYEMRMEKIIVWLKSKLPEK